MGNQDITVQTLKTIINEELLKSIKETETKLKESESGHGNYVSLKKESRDLAIKYRTSSNESEKINIRQTIDQKKSEMKQCHHHYFNHDVYEYELERWSFYCEKLSKLSSKNNHEYLEGIYKLIYELFRERPQVTTYYIITKECGDLLLKSLDQVFKTSEENEWTERKSKMFEQLKTRVHEYLYV